MTTTAGRSKGGSFQPAINYSNRLLSRFKSGTIAKIESEQEEKTVGELRSSVLRSAAICLACVLTPVTAWQFGKTHPAIPLASFLVVAVAAEQGSRASKELEEAIERDKRRKHLSIERQARQDVGTYFPDLLPTPIPTNGMRKSIVLALGNLGIDVVCTNESLAPAFVRLKVELRDEGENSIVQIRRRTADLQLMLNASATPIVTEDKGAIAIDVPRPDRQYCPIDSYLIDGFMPAGTPVTLPQGIDINNKLITSEVSDPNTCHYLVGGTTGSGKSEYLRAIVRWLMQWHPSEVQIIVIDPKRVTFTSFERVTKLVNMVLNPETNVHEPIFAEDEDVSKYQAWLPFRVIKNDTEAVAAYQWANEEQNRRYREFEKIGVENLTQYNDAMRKYGGEVLPTIVLITDEYAMQVADPAIKTRTEEEGKKLGAMARAAGICLIVATQRPSVDILPPIVRSMLPARVCLRVASEQDSAIVLGSQEEEYIVGKKLLGKGDLVFYGGADLQRLQSLFWNGKSQPADPGSFKIDAVLPEVVLTSQKGKGNRINGGGNEKSLPASQTIEVKTQEQKEALKQEIFNDFCAYRKTREEGKAPDAFFKVLFSKDYNKEQKQSFYKAVLPHLANWAIELHGKGMEPEAIVTLMFNTKDTKRFGEEFKDQVAFVKEVIEASKEPVS